MYEIKKYPDNTSYVEVGKLDYNIPVNIKNVQNSVDKIIFRINSYEDLWHLNQLVDTYNNMGVKPDIVIPSLLDAQADRRFAENQSSGLKLVCKFLNAVDANFKVFHPHNSEVVEALMDNVEIIDNSEFVNSVLTQTDEIIKSEKSGNLILFSSDAGGFKPLMKLADKLHWEGEVYGSSKARKYEDGKSKLIQVIDRQDFEGKDILIVDDICVYGGTFIGLAKMLKERNCGKLYLAISHLTVEKPNPELFALFDEVFTTNSKFDEYFPIPHKDGGGSSKTENLKVLQLF